MKSNKKFMLLSAVGIVMVVDAHSWTTIKMFSDFLPYNSFFMPMFVFISGYFFNPKSVDNYFITLIKKIKKLLIPYYIYILIFFIIEMLLKHMELICYDDITFTDVLIRIWQDGSPIFLAAPLWYVIMSFAVQIVYLTFRKIISVAKMYRNDYIELVLSVLLGLYCVHFSRTHIINPALLLLVKVGFFIEFFIMGIVYKNRIEKHIEKVKKLPVIIVILCINTIRAYIQPVAYNIACNDLATMSGFNSEYIITPLISSVLGIIFWLCIVDILVPSLGENKFINYISDNTFFIMATHIFCFNILNAILYAVNRFIVPLHGLNLDFMMSTPLYRYEPIEQFRIFYFVFGLFGSILLKRIIDKCFNYYKRVRL